MRCYDEHRRVITFTKFMSSVNKTICVYPSVALINTCLEVDLSEPVYLDICKQPSTFQYKVQLKHVGGSTMDDNDEITATGFAFCDALEAKESAALAVLDMLFCFHGVKTTLFNDLGFIELWPLYNDLSQNFKGTVAGLKQVMSEISTLIGRLDESCLLFAVEKTNSGLAEDSFVVSTLDHCRSELSRIKASFGTDMEDHKEELARRSSLSWCYRQEYYGGSYALQMEMDAKVRSLNTLKWILNKMCEETGYRAQFPPAKCTVGDFYTSEVLLVKEPFNGEHGSSVRISGDRCISHGESQESALYRAISSLSRSKGFRIIDPGFLDYRDMERDYRGLGSVIPVLCDLVVKIKSVVQRGLRGVDLLSRGYYRKLNGLEFKKELRLALADCSREFFYIIGSLDGEIRKMELYLSSSPMRGARAALQ